MTSSQRGLLRVQLLSMVALSLFAAGSICALAGSRDAVGYEVEAG